MRSYRISIHPSIFFLILFSIGWTEPCLENDDGDNCKSLKKESVCAGEFQNLGKESENLSHVANLYNCLNKPSWRKNFKSLSQRLEALIGNKERNYYRLLRDLRSQKKLKSLKHLSFVSELAFYKSNLIRPELNEAYRINSQFLEQGLSYLQSLVLGLNNYSLTRFQFNKLFKSAEIEWDQKDLIDSLYINFINHNSRTLQLIESIAWSHKNYLISTISFTKRLKLESLPWNEVENRIQQLIQIAYYDQAAILFEIYPWQQLPENHLISAIEKYVLIQQKLENWNKIIDIHTDERFNFTNIQTKLIFTEAFLNSNTISDSTNILNKNKGIGLLKNMRLGEMKNHYEKSVYLLIEYLIRNGFLEKAESHIKNEKKGLARNYSAGGLLYWQAVINLLKADYKKSDSLLMLSSSYQNHPFSQLALEYRYWFLLDSNSINRDLFFQALLNTSLDQNAKIKKLDSIPKQSALWVHGRFQLAEIFTKNKQYNNSAKLYQDISKSVHEEWAQAKSKALLAFSMEKQTNHQEILDIYSEVLIQYQNGVIAEFLRKRIKKLKR